MNINEKSMANELIKKAIEIFSIKGYVATNLTDITDALGISRGPVYYHFKDKYGLYKAAFERFDKDVRESHGRIISQDKHIINFMEDVIYDCAERNTRFGTNFFFGIDTVEELSPIKEQYDRMNADIYQEKIDYVNKAKEKGEVKRSIDPKQIADLIYIIYLGLLNALQIKMLSDYSEGEVRNLIRILLLGIERFCCD
ncbi:MAG: transcriptional regulator, TetR family [Clostridia bacterium]|jgi:AcrR family transcriptional regulator|nr:transcriptional regulator, TetR family [Clostridia bacterium]